MIGIFDSGVGGLSIYSKIKELLPETRIVYLADSANFPYGEKGEQELFRICDENIRMLTEAGAIIIVIACNSATVSTITKLRKKWSVPIVGIEPAMKVAAKETKNGRIGLIGTKSTIRNHKCEELVDKGQVVVKVHHGELVEKVEAAYGQIDDEYLKAVIEDFLKYDVDTVVLGCTHYFFLKERLEKLFPKITFLAPDEAVARRVIAVIGDNIIKPTGGDDVFLVSGDDERFSKTFDTIFKNKPKIVRKVKSKSRSK